MTLWLTIIVRTLLSLLFLGLSSQVHAAVLVNTVFPKSVTVQINQPVSLTLGGQGLNQTKGVLLSKDKAGKLKIAGMAAKFTGNAAKGKLVLTLKVKVAAGNYYLFLTDGRKLLALVPINLQIVAAKPALRTRPILPKVTGANKASFKLLPNSRTEIILQGSNLDQLTKATLTQNNRPLTGANIMLAKATANNKNIRTLIIVLPAKVIAGQVIVGLTAGKQKVAFPRNIPLTIELPDAVPVISKVQVPKDIREGQVFEVIVTATDDKALAGIHVRYADNSLIVNAKGQNKELIRVKLKASKAGKLPLEIVARDKTGNKSRLKKTMVVVLTEKNTSVIDKLPLPKRTFSLYLGQTYITAGEVTAGKVKFLSQPPVDGILVTLSVSPPSDVISLPESITISEDNWVAVFPIQTTAGLNQEISRQIVASYNNVSKQVTLVVQPDVDDIVVVPPILAGITLLSNVVRAGNTFSGQVALTANASVDDITVALSTNNSQIISLAMDQVQINAGQSTAAFSGVVGPAVGTVTISASLGADTQTTQLTVLEPIPEVGPVFMPQTINTPPLAAVGSGRGGPIFIPQIINTPPLAAVGSGRGGPVFVPQVINTPPLEAVGGGRND